MLSHLSLLNSLSFSPPSCSCTYFESEYARNAGKKMILLRMIDWNAKFEHLQARVLFGMNELVLSWKEEEPMPPSLPDDIVASLGGGGTAANDL